MRDDDDDMFARMILSSPSEFKSKSNKMTNEDNRSAGETIDTTLLHHDQTNSDSQPPSASHFTAIPNSHFWQNIDMLLEWATEQPKSKSMRYLIVGLTNTIRNGYGLKENKLQEGVDLALYEIQMDIISFEDDWSRNPRLAFKYLKERKFKK